MDKRNKWYLIIELIATILLALLSFFRPIRYELNKAEPITAGVLTALGTAIGAIGSTISNNIAQRKAIKEQNEYNTPSSQIARYQAAGLNPNLIYGTGQASAGNQSSPASYRGVNYSAQDMLSMVNAVKNLQLLDSDIAKNKAEAQRAGLESQEKAIYLSNYQDRVTQEVQEARLRNLYTTGQITLQQYQQRVLQSQADNLASQAALNNFRRTVSIPTELRISQQNANTARDNMVINRDRLSWDASEWNPRNINLKNQNRLQDYMWQWRDSDRFLKVITDLFGVGKSFLTPFVTP